MNAPFWEGAERSIDDLVDEHLAGERAMHDATRASDDRLASFLSRLSDLKRRAAFARVWPFRTRPGGAPKRAHSRTASGFSTEPAFGESAGYGAEDEVWESSPPRTRRSARRSGPVRRAAVTTVTAGALAAVLAVGVFAANAVAPLATNAALSAIASHIPFRDDAVEQLRFSAACAMQTPILDAQGALVAMAGQTDPACADPNHLTTPTPPEAATRRVEAIAAIEGRSLIRDGRAVLGLIDVAIFKRAAETLTTGAQLTGSPPLLTAIESAASRSQSLGVFEKVDSLLTAAAFVARDLTNDAAREQFILAHMPCVRGGRGSRFGYARAGGQCIELLFGKPAAATLSLGERCMLAGALGFQLLHVRAGADVETIEGALRRLARARVRARNCAERIGEDKTTIEAAIAFIDGYDPSPHIDAFQNRSVGRDVLPPVQDAIAASKIAGAATLTLDGRVQAAATAALANVLPELDGGLAPGLCFRNDPACQHPDHAVVIAEMVEVPSEGAARLAVRAIVSNRHHDVIPRSGVATPARALGSVSKIPLALLTGGHQRLCDRSFGGIHNPNGSGGVANCTDGAGLVSAERTFAESLNLPALDVAMRDNDLTLRLYQSAGYHVVGDTAGERAVGMVMGGGATAPLAQHMAILGAIWRGGRGLTARISGVDIVSGAGNASVDLKAIAANLGLKPSAIQEAARLLRGAARNGGTAPSLSSALQNLGCESVIAKTGSAETGSSKTGVRARTLVAAFSCADRSFVAAVMIGAPGDLDQAIGAVPSRRLVDLMTAALKPVLR